MIGIATKFTPAANEFATAARAGFRRAELWTDAAVLANWREVVRIARDYPFDYAIHFPNRLDQGPEVIANTVALYQALDCRALILHQPHVDRHGEALLRLDPKLKLAVENHRLTPAGFRAWASDNPGLTLDVEHFWMFTVHGSPLPVVLHGVEAFLEEFGGKLHHVHLPGYLPGQREHRPMYSSRDLVFGVLSLLARIDFEGLIVSEVDLEYQNEHDLQMDVLLFQRWLQLHGTDSDSRPPSAAAVAIPPSAR